MDRLDGQRANIDNVMRHLHLEAGVDGIISALDAPPEQTPIRALPQSDGDRRGDADETLIFEDSPSASKRHARSGAAYFVVKL